MPSKKRKPTTARRGSSKAALDSHIAFLPLLALVFLLWMLYRTLFSFPVWFDESIGKAVFFGLPVWLYLSISGSRSIVATYAPAKLYPGLMLGLAIGGSFGFLGSITSLVLKGGQVQTALLFASPLFWGEFTLSLLTAFWETLFFFSFVMVVIQERYRRWELWQQLAVVVSIFTLFHIPNAILRLSGLGSIVTIALLALFALGQALVFHRWRNFYTLVISHSLWGMVLLVHVGGILK